MLSTWFLKSSFLKVLETFTRAIYPLIIHKNNHFTINKHLNFWYLKGYVKNDPLFDTYIPQISCCIPLHNELREKFLHNLHRLIKFYYAYNTTCNRLQVPS